MSVSLALYKALVALFPDSGYAPGLNNIDFKEKNSYALYFTGGAPVNREVSEGRYLNRYLQLGLYLQTSDKSEEDLKGYAFLDHVMSKLQSLKDYTFTDDSGYTVNIQRVDLLSDIISLGTNEFGIARYSLNFAVLFQGGKNSE